MESISKTFSAKYELDRVNIDDNQLIQLINCVICFKLCDNPVVLSCCQEISCLKCYKLNTLKNNYCLKCLKQNPTVVKPGKILKDLFNSVKIKCKFECGEINDYNAYIDHEKFCKFNPDVLYYCKQCELSFDKVKFDAHNCTRELLSSFKELKGEVKKLKGEDEQEMSRIKSTLR